MTTRTEAVTTIRGRLGGDKIELGIRDATILRHIDTALRYLTKHIPKRVLKTYTVSESGIVMPKATIGITNVYSSSLPGATSSPSQAYDVFDLDEITQIKTNPGGSMSEYFARLQQWKSNYNFVACRDWKWNPQAKIVYVTSAYGAKVTIESMERHASVSDLDDNDLEWVLDYVEALSMVSEGRMRRKFTNDFLQMDGSEMVSEGTERQRELKEELPSMTLMNFGGLA